MKEFYICAMKGSLFFGIIGIFILLLLLNIYFRVKVLKSYRYLVKNRVQFTLSHFLDEKKMRSEILNRYPQHEVEILNFVRLIRRSVTMASILLAIILVFGYTLMKMRY